MAQDVIEAKPEVKQDPVVEEMTKAGLHFGHKTSKTHPKMKQYIAGVRSAVHMFDLQKTQEKLGEALEYIKSLQTAGKTLLLVGTKIQIKNLVKETAVACSLPYVSERWIGGTFTNFGTITKRIEYFRDLEQKKQAGELEKYTKKEQLDIAEELKNLELHFGGVKNLSKLPDAVFVCDLDKNQLVVKEAKNKGIPVIAIVDTNIDPTPINYVIPANDDVQSSVRYILNRIQELYVSH
jgi:small subunit ribosomal protein S2